MAEFQEDSDQKLQILTHLCIGTVILSTTIGLFYWKNVF